MRKIPAESRMADPSRIAFLSFSPCVAPLNPTPTPHGTFWSIKSIHVPMLVLCECEIYVNANLKYWKESWGQNWPTWITVEFKFYPSGPKVMLILGKWNLLVLFSLDSYWLLRLKGPWRGWLKTSRHCRRHCSVWARMPGSMTDRYGGWVLCFCKRINKAGHTCSPWGCVYREASQSSHVLS